MHRIFYLLLWLFFGLLSIGALAPVPVFTLVTWNIRDLGKSKSDEEIAFMAQVLREADVVAVQEVVGGPGGAQAVARLDAALDRTGAQWDYQVSERTRSTNNHIAERYAFFWRTDRVRTNRQGNLIAELAKSCEREPFAMTFRLGNQSVEVYNFHARPQKKQPEQEIKALRIFLEETDQKPIICGDFNVVPHHTVFNPLLKRGYQKVVTSADQKTTLRWKPKPGDYLYGSTDNILLPPQVKIEKKGVIDFVPKLPLDSINNISDHLPVYVELVASD